MARFLLFVSLLFFFFCSSFVLAVTLQKGRAFVEVSERRPIPPGWTILSPAQESRVIRLIFAIKQRNLDLLEETLYAVSDPQSPTYGHHLTIDDLTEMLAPKQEVIDRIEAWLSENGVHEWKLARNRDFITIHVPIKIASQLLQTTFFVWKHETGTELIKSLEPYSAPIGIAENLDFVAGVTDLPQIHRKQIIGKPEDTDPMIGPSQLRERYNVTAVGLGSALNNSQAVAEFQEQYYSPSDLKTFFKKYVPDYASDDIVDKVVGQNNPQAPGIEASLDIQYIMGVAPNITTWFYSTPSMDFWTDLTSWIAELADTNGIPWVHSISYGDQSESQPSGSYKDRLSAEFQKVGTRGVSIIFASGDSGTGCDFCVLFGASFPATSPFVTSVGATHFLDGAVGPEGAVTAFGSGGGFSDHFDQPSYQTDAVNHYFQVATKIPPSFRYRKSGRATPDVSALGIGFSVYNSGELLSVGGTSASTPTFSAIISLLNDIRLSQGKPTLGFLNPWIYQTAANVPGAFYDVTVGSNPDGCCLEGFECAQGWDPVTGVGTPNFAILSQNV